MLRNFAWQPGENQETDEKNEIPYVKNEVPFRIITG